MRHLSVIGLALLLALSGCATPVGFEKDPEPDYFKQEYRSGAVTKEEFAAGGLAIAGIVVRDDLDLERTGDLPPAGDPFDHAIQTGIFCPTFEWKYVQKVGKPALLKFRDYDDFVPDDILAETWRDYAQGGYLAAEVLRRIHATEPGVRFIALIRIEEDIVFNSIKTAFFASPEQFKTSSSEPGVAYDPHAVNKSRPPTMARKVGFIMGIFDLEKAICVWEGRTMKEIHKSIDPEDLNNYQGHRVIDQGGGDYGMVEIEDLSGAPTFTEALEKGLDTLFSDMKKGLGQ